MRREEHIRLLQLHLMHSGITQISMAYLLHHTVANIAGDGSKGMKNGTPLSCKFGATLYVAWDSKNIIIADFENDLIRKLSNNKVRTIAGSSEGYKDDVGIRAKFSGPAGLAVSESTRAIIVCDVYNERLRRIDHEGKVTSIAGNGNTGPAVDGPALESPLSHLRSVVIDSTGNIIFCTFDREKRTSKIVQLKSGVLRVLGVCHAFINGITTDSNNIIYISCRDDCIRRLNFGKLEVVAGVPGTKGYTVDGPALKGMFSSPCGIAFDQDGSLVICDKGNQCVRSLSSDRKVVSLLAGTPGWRYRDYRDEAVTDGDALVDADFYLPNDVIVAGGDIFVVGRARLRMISTVL